VPHDLEQTISLLERTPAVLNALLRDLPEQWTLCTEGDRTWNAVDIVAHLIHGEETDWMPRARTILQFGTSREFEKFDREGHRHAAREASLGQLLDEFARLRADNLRALRALHLQESHLDLHGRHPALGVVTLSQLLATWAAHDMTHLHQLSRVLAHQYRDAVGPWSKYLGVLHCDGHSEA
jgi:hypothetical protein